MIFKLHSAFALGLIALVAGTYLISKVSCETGCCKKFAKIVGVFVIITSLLGLICITYHGVKYGKAGGYDKMGRGMKGNCPMMQKMMQQQQQLPPATE